MLNLNEANQIHFINYSGDMAAGFQHCQSATITVIRKTLALSK